MDIISGIVVSTSVFLFCTALVAVIAALPVSRGQHGIGPAAKGVAQRAMATSLVVYFVAVLNLLLIAQQISLALGSFVVGLALLVVFYVEPAIRTRGAESAEEPEEWGH